MLVLSRKRHELVRVGCNIEIGIVDIRGDKVRLGICAPTCWPVHREEVANAMLRGGQVLADPLEAAMQQVAKLRAENAELKAKLVA